MLPTVATNGNQMYSIRPATLEELLAVPAGQLCNVDIARMNLLCSIGLINDVGFDLEKAVALIDHWAEEAAAFTDRSQHLLTAFPDVLAGSEPLWRLYCLARALHIVGGVKYCDAEVDRSSEADWSKADRHLIHGLVGQTRHGTCASLPVLFVAVGRRMSYPLRLVHSPGHVFVRWDGLAHQCPDWRERRNAEFTSGFDSFEDAEYYAQPFKWTSDIFEMERLRYPMPLYLRSLSPAEELASFLVQRGHAFEATQSFSLAIDAYQAAIELAPHNDMYAYFRDECRGSQLNFVLSPWGLTGRQYCSLIEKRLSNGDVTLPWEKWIPDSNSRCNPWDDPETARVLIATQHAVAARMGCRDAKLPRLQSPSALIDTFGNFMREPEQITQRARLVDKLLADGGVSIFED